MVFSIVRGGQLKVKAHGVEMIVDYGYIGNPTSENESLLDANVYLKNYSTDTLHLVVGPTLGPRYSTGLVGYLAVLDSDNEGNTIKPSPGALDIIELKSGEMAKLGHFRCSTQKADEGKIIVFYDIDGSLPKFYPDVWAHKLSVNIDIK
jgi:hypothetical protein